MYCTCKCLFLTVLLFIVSAEDAFGTSSGRRFDRIIKFAKVYGVCKYNKKGDMNEYLMLTSAC